jgi:hypothetical protein
VKDTVLCNVTLCILKYVQQDAKLHSVFYLETAVHVSGGTTTHHQERKLLYPHHLEFVTPLLLPATISNAVDTVYALLIMGGGNIRNM